MLMIDRIAYRRERGNGSAQRVRNVIYDCLVSYFNLFINQFYGPDKTIGPVCVCKSGQ